MILAFNWTPLLLNKIASTKNFADSCFAKSVESANIDLIHNIDKCLKNHWSRSAVILRSSKFNSNILLKVSILNA